MVNWKTVKKRWNKLKEGYNKAETVFMRWAMTAPQESPLDLTPPTVQTTPTSSNVRRGELIITKSGYVWKDKNSIFILNPRYGILTIKNQVNTVNIPLKQETLSSFLKIIESESSEKKAVNKLVRKSHEVYQKWLRLNKF